FRPPGLPCRPSIGLGRPRVRRRSVPRRGPCPPIAVRTRSSRFASVIMSDLPSVPWTNEYLRRSGSRFGALVLVLLRHRVHEFEVLRDLVSRRLRFLGETRELVDLPVREQDGDH